MSINREKIGSASALSRDLDPVRSLVLVLPRGLAPTRRRGASPR